MVNSEEPIAGPMNVQVSTGPEYTEIKVAGEIDIVTAPTLRDTVDAAVDVGPRRIIVNLTDVTFIDSSGLRVLLGALERLGSGGLGVVARGDNIRRTFAISGIDAVIPLFESTEQAVGGPDPQRASSE